MTSRHSYLKGVITALGSVVVTILAIELFLFYVLDIRCPGSGSERFFQFSLLTGHMHKPSVAGYWYRYNDGTKTRVSTNRYGFSDSEWDLEKTRPRIALIGDSTTEFWESDPEDRGDSLIEDMVEAKFEVMNFGVRGYGTDQVYILFEKVGIHFCPDIVIYMFCVNDIADNAVTEGKPYFVADPAQPEHLRLENFPVKMGRPAKTDRPVLRAIDGFLRDRSFLFRKSRGLIMNFIGYHYPLETHADFRPYKRDYNGEDNRRTDVTLKLISKIDSLAKAKGMEFLLVEGIHRPVLDSEIRDRLIAEYGDVFDFDRLSRTLAAYSKAHGIEFLSLPGVARAKGIRASELMHREDTMHLDERGIRLFASSVVERLWKLGWLERYGERALQIQNQASPD